MKDQLTRIKELIYYPNLIIEEMEISSNFNENNFEINDESKSVVLEVGIDPENENQHRITLIIQFTNRSGYNELVFYFNITNKNKTEITVEPRSIYDKNIANQYLPKELQKSIAFFNKLKEMFKKLIIMEKPNIFFIETYEDYTDEKQLLAHNPIIEIILQNGYVIESQGLTHDKKKYHWKFVQKTEQQIKESKEDGFSEFIKTFKKDDKYWAGILEDTKKIMLKNNKK